MKRRLIAAVLAATATLAALLAVLPEPGTPVVVAARDLTPGTLRPGDLRLAPLNAPPDGALRAPPASGVLAAPMRRGEPLTDVRPLHPVRLAPGLVAAPVRIADPDAAKLIEPGSTIGVLAAWESQSAQLVADDVTVLSTPRTEDDQGALIVLATTTTQAAQLAAAQSGGRLSVILKPHPA
ncbi:flagellar biosynthesis protein FlgA [Nonomuraea sp. NPDC050547]|uniref:flagellar biosynthesis protein FlgA n=1 Tax=Nonomuraea sp. NPDC050547 TaxID=3364368 RepID=UPI00379CCE78